MLSVTGDIGRMKRQQAFIASMVNKVMSAGTLTRPDRVYTSSTPPPSRSPSTRTSTAIAKLADLASEFRDTGLAHIKFVTVPFAEYEPDPNRLIWTAEAENLWQRIKHDQPLGQDFSEDSLSADDPVGTASGPSSSSTGIERDSSDDQQRLDAGLCA